MFQENTIISIINDLSSSIDYIDKVEWLGYNKNVDRNFKAKFWSKKEVIEIEVKDDDWLNLDIENTNESWSLNFCLGRKFSAHLQLEVDYLRKQLERWYKENERERDRMGY